MHLDAVHSCTEKCFIFQEILRAKSDFGASLQLDRRPMASPDPYRRRLEMGRIYELYRPRQRCSHYRCTLLCAVTVFRRPKAIFNFVRIKDRTP